MKTLAFLIFAGALFAQPQVSVVTSAAGAHSVSNTWTWAQGTLDPASGFTLLRGTTPGGPYPVTAGTLACATGTCAAASTNYTLVDATANVPGTTYCFVVQATAAGGNSPNSNESCVKIPTSIAAPTSETATAN